ncbi:YciI family protein [Phytomonospora sp. NPDC050363]|uniref:YciI family protein n=1 Tax=Phytomonospora sp. NPDC050363 TaxID=3155642 RepID=UPI0033DD5B9E
MRYLMTTLPTDDQAEFTEQMGREMGAFIQELSASGALLATGGLEPGGVLLSSKDGEITVTDGPFAEAKEAVVGFALIEVRSKEEAIELATRFWRIVGNGKGLVQQVFGP